MIQPQNKNAVETSKSNQESVQFGFDWSFKPFRIFFKLFIGIDLSITKNNYKKEVESNQSSNLKYCWIPTIRASHIFLVFIVNFMYNLMYVGEMIHTILETPSSSNETSSNETNSNSDAGGVTPREFMEYVTSDIYFFGIHCVFLLVTCCSSSKTSSWTCLWIQIRNIQRECIEDATSDLFKKYRKTVVFAFAYIFVVIIIIAYKLIFNNLIVFYNC